MSQAELKLIKEAENCTLYTIQFVEDSEDEFQKFDEIIRQGERDGSIIVTENIIETDKTFEV